MRQTLKVDNQRRTCDTDTAKLRAEHVVGAFGDPAGYEEKLYRNRTGFWFVWGVGGENSPYANGEEIRAVDEDFVKNALNNWNN